MKDRINLPLALLFLAFSAGANQVSAQAFDVGKNEYLTNCAACHGAAGKGNGPVAKHLKTPVPDLTVLSKNNAAGMFPVNHVWGVIDGRALFTAHGSKAMPVWGKEYTVLKQAGVYGPFAAAMNTQNFVNGRILALIGYIESIQQK